MWHNTNAYKVLISLFHEIIMNIIALNSWFIITLQSFETICLFSEFLNLNYILLNTQ